MIFFNSNDVCTRSSNENLLMEIIFGRHAYLLSKKIKF